MGLLLVTVLHKVGGREEGGCEAEGSRAGALCGGNRGATLRDKRTRCPHGPSAGHGEMTRKEKQKWAGGEKNKREKIKEDEREKRKNKEKKIILFFNWEK